MSKRKALKERFCEWGSEQLQMKKEKQNVFPKSLKQRIQGVDKQYWEEKAYERISLYDRLYDLKNT